MSAWPQLVTAIMGLVTALAGGVAAVIVATRTARQQAQASLDPEQLAQARARTEHIGHEIARVRVQLESLPIVAPEPERPRIVRGGLGVVGVRYGAARTAHTAGKVPRAQP